MRSFFVVSVIAVALLVNIFVFVLVRTAVGFVMTEPLGVVVTDPIIVLMLLFIICGCLLCTNQRPAQGHTSATNGTRPRLGRLPHG
jgi:uncharacterized integral membrane protein